MKKIILFLITFITTITFANSKDDILGFYITEKSKSGNQIIVEIYKDNGKYNGVIRELTVPKYTSGENAGKEIMDLHNQDKNLRSRKLVGVNFVYGFNYNEKNNTYENGRIYNPENGKVYYSQMKFDKNGNLNVKGSIDKGGLIGKTQTWKKYKK